MSKKMKIIPSIFKINKETKQPWQWPSCKRPKTLSFRACKDVVFTATEPLEIPIMPSSSSSEPTSFSNDDEFFEEKQPLDETVINGVRLSERLFFDPDETNSIVKQEAKTASSDHGVMMINFPFKGSVAMSLESDDPYLDFKKSMQAMVENDQGMVRDWDCLEELLGWYLRMNGKMNHGFIIGAFLDLVSGLVASSSSNYWKNETVMCSDSTLYLSASSSFSSPVSSNSSPLSPKVVVVRHDQMEMN